MANKLTKIIKDADTAEETMTKQELVPEKKPVVIETIYRSDADTPPVQEPEGERETIVRSRPEKPQTVTSERTLNIKGTDITYSLTRRDPYGYWHISADKGKTPDVLRGSYTSALLAEKAIQKYLANR